MSKTHNTIQWLIYNTAAQKVLFSTDKRFVLNSSIAQALCSAYSEICQFVFTRSGDRKPVIVVVIPEK